MAPKQRKARTDSLAHLVAEGTAPDHTAAAPPDVEGTAALDKIGMGYYARLWRSGLDRWSEADLWLLIEAASLQQQMYHNRLVCMETPPPHRSRRPPKVRKSRVLRISFMVDDYPPHHIKMAEIEVIIGGPFNPPKTPAAKTLYSTWIMNKIRPSGMASCYLLAGGVPDQSRELDDYAAPMLISYSEKELRKLA